MPDKQWNLKTDLDDRVHEASVAQIAQSTNTRLGLLTQTPISVSPRSPTEVVPGMSSDEGF